MSLERNFAVKFGFLNRYGVRGIVIPRMKEGAKDQNVSYAHFNNLHIQECKWLSIIIQLVLIVFVFKFLCFTYLNYNNAVDGTFISNCNLIIIFMIIGLINLSKI